jgi:hypothetical protein
MQLEWAGAEFVPVLHQAPLHADELLRLIKHHSLKIIIFMALQPFVAPWPLFQCPDPIHSR